MNKCRSCGAPIMWAITEKGRRMPLDPEPTADGNLLVEEIGGIFHVRSAVGDSADRHTSHFATCPNAARHRRRRKAER